MMLMAELWMTSRDLNVRQWGLVVVSKLLFGITPAEWEWNETD